MTTRAIYFFKPYHRECRLCPMETGCWDPIPLEDPIPISSIRSFLHSKGPKMLGIVLKETRGGFFSVGKGQPDVRIIILHEYKAKDRITTMIREKHDVGFMVDPIFMAFSTSTVPEFERMEMVSVSLSPHETKRTLFDGYSKLQNPRMLGLGRREIRFYRVNFAYWQPIGIIHDDETASFEKATASTYLTQEEIARQELAHKVCRPTSSRTNSKSRFAPAPPVSLWRSRHFDAKSPRSSTSGQRKTRNPSCSSASVPAPHASSSPSPVTSASKA